MTTIEQWQAGLHVEGHPPWDGTGVPFPLDANGWPVIPDQEPPVLTLNVTPASGPYHSQYEVTLTTDRPIPGPVSLFVDNGSGDGWYRVGPMLQDGDGWRFPGAANANEVMNHRAEYGEFVSNEVAFAVDPSNITLTLTVTPDPLPENLDAVATLVASEAAVGVALTYTVDGGAVQFLAPSSSDGWVTQTATIPEAAYAEGQTLAVQAQLDNAFAHVSRVVAAAGPLADPNMGWTVGELRQFAADHEPPIPIPHTANKKAEILAVILAYIQAHPEEN